VGLAFLAIPPLARVPARLVAGCGKWIALGAILELLSILGYTLVFALVFGTGMSKRQRLGAALRALGAGAVLPAGGLVGPAMGVRAAGAGSPPAGLIRSTFAFIILTNAPSLLVLGALGLSLWFGWPSGPHSALLTLPAAGLAWGLIAGGWLIGGSRPNRRSPGDQRRNLYRQLVSGLTILREGAGGARRLAAARNWKLVGALGYYAFDNAVLWTAFRAYGHVPAPSVIVMGYVVGSLATVVPVPGGIGAVEGGLIGALVLYGAPPGPAAGAVFVYRGLSLSLQLTLGAVAWASFPAVRLRAPHGRPHRGVRAIRAAHGARRARVTQRLPARGVGANQSRSARGETRRERSVAVARAGTRPGRATRGRRRRSGQLDDA
jgi:uncharacterized membrane protein YbhN (UPF0104 family)